MWIGISLYLLLGIVTIVISAYDPYTQSFDFELVDGWILFRYQKYVLWGVICVGAIYFLPKELIERTKDRKNVRAWRTNKSFTKKL